MNHFPDVGKMVVLALVAALAGCATRTQSVAAPTVAKCAVAVPTRPDMPTEALRPGAGLHLFAKSAAAEIDRREAYELELVAALGKCRD